MIGNRKGVRREEKAVIVIRDRIETEILRTNYEREIEVPDKTGVQTKRIDSGSQQATK